MRKHKRIAGNLPLIKMIIYGLGATGKTHLAADFSQDDRTAPALILNSGGNPEKLTLWERPPEIIDIEHYKDLDEIYDFFASDQSPKHSLRKDMEWPADLRFKTLIIDTFSDIQSQYVLQAANPTYKPGEFSTITPPNIKSWQSIGLYSINTARAFIQLPLNVIMVLQEKTQVDLERQTSKVRPCLDGQSVEIIPSWVSLMGRMQMVHNKQGELVPKIWWSSETEELWTKNQLCDALGRGMVNPTVKDILDKIQNHYS